jgi:hypothetical protein
MIPVDFENFENSSLTPSLVTDAATYISNLCTVPLATQVSAVLERKKNQGIIKNKCWTEFVTGFYRGWYRSNCDCESRRFLHPFVNDGDDNANQW